MIYLDYNATTPLCEPALAAMLPYLGENFGNASSIHAAGRQARAAVDDARDQLANLLRVRPNELIFTGSGTESNNLAVLGLAHAYAARGRHVVCSRIEHHAVLHAFEHLEHNGFEVTWLNVDSLGRVDLDQLRAALREDTTLVSVMSANNETGTIQPLHEISQICRARGVLLHSDMVQSFGKTETDLSLLDAASFAAHKFYGPKGAGLLYLRSGIPLSPITFGGSQENQRRAGTENVPAIVGMSAAAEFVLTDWYEEQTRERKLGDRLAAQLASVSVRNSSPNECLANTLNVSFDGIDSETMLMALDLEGVSASSGSACMVGSVVPSHVLLAMGFSRERASSAIRFSLGKQTTADEIETAAGAITRVTERIRSSLGRTHALA